MEERQLSPKDSEALLKLLESSYEPTDAAKRAFCRYQKLVIDITCGIDPNTLTEEQRQIAAEARLREAERLESLHGKCPGIGE